MVHKFQLLNGIPGTSYLIVQGQEMVLELRYFRQRQKMYVFVRTVKLMGIGRKKFFVTTDPCNSVELVI